MSKKDLGEAQIEQTTVTTWKQIHALEDLSQVQLPQDKLFWLELGMGLSRSQILFSIFIASEENYNQDEAELLANMLTEPTRLAEYMQLKYKSEDKIKLLYSLILNFLKQEDEVYKELEALKSFKDEVEAKNK